MKKILLKVLLAFAALALNAAQAAQQLMPLPQQSQAAHLSAEILAKYHYKRISLDAALSSKIFGNYLKALDGEKVFFLQADIDRFADARTSLGDAIRKEDLSTPFAIFNLYQQRITERFGYARALLKQGFDFDSQESYQYIRKDAPWPRSEDELNDLWRKRVKNDWLRLKLAGKDTKSIVDTLEKRYDNFLKSVSRVKGDDAFQVFMSAYAMTIDPHTDYFGLRASDEFDISMKLSLIGIGAVLQDKDEYTTIRELLSGGPAALSGKLKVGDRITGVGQGENSPITDVMGWRIDDAVALIRGTEDTVVLLDVLPAEAGPDGKHKLVSLIRKKISLDKQAAQKSILEVKDGGTTRHIGVISLPGFYQDFAARQQGDKDFRSATRDVSRLLDELKKDKVDSVLIDLRNNGGGSLLEAIELTGLFIDTGPVVQQRDSQGDVTVERDTDAGLAWDGPMGVLINHASASASEIFAAAIQDYGRGVVIGEPSFGKGTVQTVVSLDQLAKNEQPKFGELKMTIAQFFRINGGTTQLRGVTPDIRFPSFTDEEDFGESSFDNALPWMQIKAADYKPFGDLTRIVPLLASSHNARVSKDKDFQYLLEDISEFSARRKKNTISLNEAERRKERRMEEARIKSREKEKSGETSSAAAGKESAATRAAAFEDDGLQSSERNLAADLAIEKANKDAKDVLLDEAVHILGDEVGLLNANPGLAATLLPPARTGADQSYLH
ncbi:MAG: carboxy terminal-processing peptidase [Nitrosomonadales bacterium]|nr:carboxy terminal-processing peptidase [Nitrosomonadales bacterium]